jgi:L-threonylcarbamoyladenylate synthase
VSEQPLPVGAESVRRATACLRQGGVVVFPADTVYGLACEPESEQAVSRLYALKGRPPDRPAAVMFFRLAALIDRLPELDETSRSALQRLLPGPVTALVPNPARRFPLACGPEPSRLGLRVPGLTSRLEPLAEIDVPVLQSSANPSGGRDARRLDEVPEGIRSGADLVLDAGELPGTPSTVVDLTRYGQTGDAPVVREGAVTADRVRGLLSGRP